jgi:AraC-like DNA-binding protein
MFPQRYQQQFDKFQASVESTFCPMSIAPGSNAPGHFNYEISSHNLDLTTLASISSEEIQVNRNPEKVSQVASSYYLVKFQLQGNSRLQQLGREAILRPGDYALASTTEPYRLDFDGFYKQVVLVCPQQLLQQYIPDPEYYLCRPMSPESGMPAVLNQFVSSVYSNIDNLKPPMLQRLETQMLDLLVMTLQQKSSDNLQGNIDRTHEQLTRVKQFIQKNLHQGELNPRVIANGVGFCLRHLHSLFETEELTLSKYIKIQRLDMARRLLSTSVSSITQIAFHVGFNDTSHFNRCFKEHFNITPSQLRKKSI